MKMTSRPGFFWQPIVQYASAMRDNIIVMEAWDSSATCGHLSRREAWGSEKDPFWQDYMVNNESRLGVCELLCHHLRWHLHGEQIEVTNQDDSGRGNLGSTRPGGQRSRRTGTSEVYSTPLRLAVDASLFPFRTSPKSLAPPLPSNCTFSCLSRDNSTCATTVFFPFLESQASMPIPWGFFRQHSRHDLIHSSSTPQSPLNRLFLPLPVFLPPPPSQYCDHIRTSSATTTHLQLSVPPGHDNHTV